MVTVPDDGWLQVIVVEPPVDTSQPVGGLLITFSFVCAKATTASTEVTISPKKRILDVLKFEY